MGYFFFIKNMFFLRIFILFVTLCLSVGEACALTEARLLQQSSSGLTAVFNLGSQDALKQGDYAIIVKQIKDLDTRDLRLIPVARAKNIKVNSDHSIWVLFKIFDGELLVRGEKYNLLSESFMLNGRKDPSLGRLSIVNPKKLVKENTQMALSSDRDRLSKLKDQYDSITETRGQIESSGVDAQIIDLEIWNQNGGARHRSSLFKSVHKTEWTQQHRFSTFEKMVMSYIQRVNDPDFNYDDFYEKQKKSKFAHEFAENTNYDSEYNRFLRNQSLKNTADAKLYRSLLEKGESWSEDFSDEELRSVLRQVSILQEKDRRDWIRVKPTQYMAAVELGLPINDTQTEEDANYRREGLKSFAFDFEAVPVLGHKTLERFSLNATLRSNYAAFKSNGTNADLNEFSLSLGGNWYPFNPPYAFERPVFFLGAYLRTGQAQVESPSLNESANYTVLSFPGLRLGYKYLLKNNFGMRLSLSLETLKIDRYESSQLNSSLPDSANIVESKAGISLLYAF
jgi:Protein of unknown function (DUF3575)